MGTKLFVGNLSFEVSENDLQDLFAQAGSVSSVNLMQDRGTGRSRGFGFVEMATEADTAKAISMFSGKEFKGRALTVNEARPREERPSGYQRRPRLWRPPLIAGRSDTQSARRADGSMRAVGPACVFRWREPVLPAEHQAAPRPVRLPFS
jgi:RNA recognition motif-containing protein